MYVAIKKFTIYKEGRGLRVIKVYQEGDTISNWKYFWMKRKYKENFQKPERYALSNPEEAVVTTEPFPYQNRRGNYAGGGPTPIYDDWTPHDDHMVGNTRLREQIIMVEDEELVPPTYTTVDVISSDQDYDLPPQLYPDPDPIQQQVLDLRNDWDTATQQVMDTDSIPDRVDDVPYFGPDPSSQADSSYDSSSSDNSSYGSGNDNSSYDSGSSDSSSNDW